MRSCVRRNVGEYCSKGGEEEKKKYGGSSKKMAYKMATRSPSGSLVHRDTDAFFFCRPLPTRASGIPLPFIFSPGYLFASVLLLYALSSGIC